VPGGALGLAVQESVNQYCLRNDLPVRRLRFMEVSYLSPCKGRVLITVTPLCHLQTRDRDVTALQQRDHLPYVPKEGGVADSFRVVIRAMDKKGGEVKKATGPSKIYVQALVILY
jgi:hypothetical protein